MLSVNTPIVFLTLLNLFYKFVALILQFHLGLYFFEKRISYDADKYKVVDSIKGVQGWLMKKDAHYNYLL